MRDTVAASRQGAGRARCSKIAQTSERFVQQDAALIAESQKLRYYPLVARSATGCTITDVDGKEYLDLAAGWCVANTGVPGPASPARSRTPTASCRSRARQA